MRHPVILLANQPLASALGRAVLAWSVAMAAAVVAHGATWEVQFTPPNFLSGPQIARAAAGNTYSFTGGADSATARLTITIVEIPPALSAAGPQACVDAFLDEHRKRMPKLFAAPSQQPLTVGGRKLETWSWLAPDSRAARSGVISCMPHRGHYVAIAFEDEIAKVTQTFPAIRQALESLTLR